MNTLEIEGAKLQGNKEFQKGNLNEAVNCYQNAINDILKVKVSLSASTDEKETIATLKATLISNLAMCRLKQCEQSNIKCYLQALFQIIDEISSAIASIDGLTGKAASDAKTLALRSKLFYRRAKARYTLAINHATINSSKISNMQLIQLLANAQTDLQQLLNFDAKNKAARMLLEQVKVNSAEFFKESGISSSSSPLGSALNNLQESVDGKNDIRSDNDDEKVTQSLKFIHASILDDLTNATNELLKNDNRGGRLLISLGFPKLANSKKIETQALALQSLSSACMYPAFASSFQRIIKEAGAAEFESKLYEIISSMDRPDVVNAAISLQIRLTVHCHLQQDDAYYCDVHNSDESKTAKSADKGDLLSAEHQINTCSAAFRSSHEACKSMGLHLLSTWLESNPLNFIHAQAANDEELTRISYSKIKEPNEDEVRQMAPRDLANYRKRCASRARGRIDRSRRNALKFCGAGGLNNIISSATLSSNFTASEWAGYGYWRRECILAVGRVINHIRDETAPRVKDGCFVDADTRRMIETFFKEKEHQLTIEEVVDEEGSYFPEDNGDSELNNCMKRCLFATALLLANGEVGSWALKNTWKNAKQEWSGLASSGNYRAMSAASEFASAAAGVEEARSWISSCIDATTADSIWRQLLTCEDREIRSGAASAMAKLGLADKSVSSDEGELFALLEVAAGLLEEGQEAAASDSNKSCRSSYQAPMERGVELLSYLSSKTSVKDEITHGHAFSIKPSLVELTVIERLVQIADPTSKVSPAIRYSLATIFASLSVSIDTLRREAFADKEITPEQYDDLRAMGKTEEERKKDAAKEEVDSPEAVTTRVKTMAERNVPRALVNLIDNATEATLEQVVIAMGRIACETSVRGAMIQQGCLSACIKLVKNGELTEKEKKIVRFAQHAIAKILISTNPSLLNTSQCMGSIQPLIMLVRDHESSDFQKFEALLSLTNLASFNDSTKQHIVAEKGIPVLSYAMFSNHELVRRAATEAMSNLVPNMDMIEHLREHEKLKVWIAFASDFEDHFECARAALGCLAMVTQDDKIAGEFSKASNAEAMLKSVLECGKLELMHRLLVVVLNLLEHGGKCKDLVVSTGTIAFCRIYAETYNDGSQSQGLGLSVSDQDILPVTVDLAKTIVLASTGH